MDNTNSQIPVPGLTDLLWQSLLQVESSVYYRPDDPELAQFRREILRMIADLEILKMREDEADPAKCA